MANGNSGYVVPIGGDATEFFKTLDDIDRRLSAMEKLAATSTNTLKEGYSAASQAATGAATAAKKAEKNWGLLGGVVNAFSRHARKAKEDTDDLVLINGKLNKSIDSINDRLKQLKDLQQRTNDPKQLREYNREMDRLDAQLKQIKNVGVKGFDELGRSIKGTENKLGYLGQAIRRVGTYIAIYFTVNAIKNFAKEIVAVSAKFQAMEGVLTNALGTRSGARKAMQDILEFAAKTPFAVDELTGAFVKLVNRGFVPTMKQMRSLGDLAASQGKNIDQLVEALLDAQTGEFERLKEFGIRAHQANDRVTLSFKGQTVVVAKNNEAIKDAILGFGELKGVAGGMDIVARTLTGKLSNMGDTVTQIEKGIGDLGNTIVSKAVDGMNSWLTSVKEFFGLDMVTQLQRENAEITALATAILGAKNNQQLRNISIDRLIAVYPEFFKGLDREKVSNEEIAQRLATVNFQYERRIALAQKQALVDKFSEKFAKTLADSSDEMTRIITLAQKMNIEIGNVDFTNKDDLKELELVITNTLKHQQDNISMFELLQRKLKETAGGEIETVTGVDFAFKNLYRSLVKIEPQLAAMNYAQEQLTKETETYNGINAERIKQITAENEKLAESAKLKGANTAAIQAQMQANVAEISRLSNGTLNLTALYEQQSKSTGKVTQTQKELNKARKEAEQQLHRLVELNKQLTTLEGKEEVGDATERRKNELKAQYTNEVNALDAEEALLLKKKNRSETEVEQLKVIAKIKAQLEKQYNAEIFAIDLEAGAAEYQLMLDSQADQFNLLQESKEKELAAIDRAEEEQMAAYRQKYAGKEETLEKLEILLAEKSRKARAEVHNKYDLQDLDTAEKAELARIKQSKEFEGSWEYVEEQRNLAIMRKQLEYAQKRLALLRAQNKTENAALIADLEAQIAEMQNELSKKGKSSKGSWLNTALGMTDTEIKSVVNQIQNLADQIFSIFEKLAQDKIDQKQKEIDFLNEQIDAQEEIVEKEKALRDKGYANNVKAQEETLAKLKQQRDKDLADQKENQKQLAKIEIEKQAMKLATSVADMIVAVAAIISSGAEQGGWAGAIAAAVAAAGVVGSFVSLRDSVKAYQTLGDGGIAGGDSHAEGGNKYISMDGNDPSILEIEKGEWVMNAKSSRKHNALLEAINKDDFSGLEASDYSVRKLLEDTGVYLQEGTLKEGINAGSAAQDRKISLEYGGSSDDSIEVLEEISANTRKMADKTEESSVLLPDGTEIYQTRNTKRIIRNAGTKKV